MSGDNVLPYQAPDDIWDVKMLKAMRIGDSFRQSLTAEVDDLARIEFNERVYRMAAYVLQEHLAEDVYVGETASKWPETTWQMFKETHQFSWWLHWLVKRRPVRYIVDTQVVGIQVDRYVNYPEANVQIKTLGRPFPFETVKELGSV